MIDDRKRQRAEYLMESSARWIKAVRTNENTWRLRAGLRVARITRQRVYGTKAVPRLAKETNIAKSTLYEYEDVWALVYRWLGLSARRVFSMYPTLDYTHLRIVLREFADFEDQIDALMMAVDLCLTPEQFGVEIRKWRGEAVPPLPVFNERGDGEAVVASFLQQIQNLPNWRARQFHIVVRE